MTDTKRYVLLYYTANFESHKTNKIQFGFKIDGETNKESRSISANLEKYSMFGLDIVYLDDSEHLITMEYTTSEDFFINANN